MEPGLRNSPTGALDNDQGTQGRKQGLSSTTLIGKAIGPFPMSSTSQEQTQSSTSLSSMTGRQIHLPREKIHFNETT